MCTFRVGKLQCVRAGRLRGHLRLSSIAEHDPREPHVLDRLPGAANLGSIRARAELVVDEGLHHGSEERVLVQAQKGRTRRCDPLQNREARPEEDGRGEEDAEEQTAEYIRRRHS